MPERPVWFLDIDGTLGPLSTDPAVVDAVLYERRNGDLSAVPYRRALADRIADLVTRGDVEIRWLTTWPPHWVADWQRVGLGPWPIERQPYRPTGRWWKSAVVEHWLEEHPDTRAVWTDDDIKQHLARYEDRLLRIAPDPERGLTDHDLDRIEGWLLGSDHQAPQRPMTTDRP